MTNELLLIPDKPDIERDSIANSWIKNGGEVLRIGKFWEKPDIGSNRVAIYGNDTFGLVLAQVIGVDLVLPKDEVICQIDCRWTKRNIDLFKLSDAEGFIFPTFIKPLKPKTFTSRIYSDCNDFLKETNGIDSTESVIKSDIISIQSELRAFILEGKVLDLAFYEGNGNVSEAKKFIEDFLNSGKIDLPKTFVLDLGYNKTDKWFIIEFNSSWGAGLNFCKPDKVIEGIRQATIN